MLVPRPVRGRLDLRLVVCDVVDQFIADCGLASIFIDGCPNVSYFRVLGHDRLCAFTAHAPINGAILLHRLRCQPAELVFDPNQVGLEQTRP
jgi:hypothetical protein